MLASRWGHGYDGVGALGRWGLGVVLLLSTPSPSARCSQELTLVTLSWSLRGTPSRCGHFPLPRYFLSERWLSTWKNYSFCDQEDMLPEDRGPKPGPIDNSHLLVNPEAPVAEQRLRDDLSSDDYCTIPLGVWSALCSLYSGSGPAIARPVVCKPNSNAVRDWTGHPLCPVVPNRRETPAATTSQEFFAHKFN